MKKLFTAAALVFAMLFSYNAVACEQVKKVEIKEEVKKPEMKRVCVMQKNARTGADREVCRTIKIHQKLEGTQVPNNKK